jgi:predicted RNA-binding protein YlxR (DUF448 family)
MRSPQHEPANEPERRCIISGDRAPKGGLIRLALGPDGEVAPDVRARAPGRGAWIGVDRSAFEAALSKGKLKGALIRAFKTSAVNVPEDLAPEPKRRLNAQRWIGLAWKPAPVHLLPVQTGSRMRHERDKVLLLLHASDAGEDGNRKLDQAWRVGSDLEGSGRQGWFSAQTALYCLKRLGGKMWSISQ